MIHEMKKKLQAAPRWLYTAWRTVSGRPIAATHVYNNYTEYVEHQKAKTTDKSRIAKWQGEEWETKLAGFRDIFNRNRSYIQGKKSAICLGARTGQEVKALQDLGIDAIGVDLVPFPPYTIEADIHALPFEERRFDFAFTNIFDHVLYPEKFCAEIERVTKPGAVIMIHLAIGIPGDVYTETVVYNSQPVKDLFEKSDVKEDRAIRNTFDGMNWEIILERK